MEPVPLYFYKR